MRMVRFDTRDTKPRIRVLLFFTAAAGIAVGILARRGLNAAICGVMAAYALCVILTLLWAFREQLRYNPYSYNTIFYFGFALFAFYVMVAYLVLTVHTALEPEVYTSLMITHVLLRSAKNYMIITSPFLLVFSAALCISNLSLIRHEGLRVVNLLGIVLSFLLVGGVVFLLR